MAKPSGPITAHRFNDAYYRRYYENPGTQVTSLDEMRPLVGFVTAYLEYLGVSIRRVIDFGAGIGLWRDLLREYVRGHSWKYMGVDVSPTVCERFGWTEGSVVSYRPRGKFDLVLCSGVLQYVQDRDLGPAIHNLAACCRGALYLHVPTVLDREEVLDRRVSDQDVFFRTGKVYRSHLRKYFFSCGGGLFVPRDSSLPLWELESEG